MREKRKKIGIFSGTFDPIHIGHAMLANYISRNCGLDEVWILVSKRNPLKSNSAVASDSDRYEMAKLVARRCAKVKASDFEFSLPSPSYTYTTLKLLREKYPDSDFCFIMGSDNWNLFDKWWEHDKIRSEFEIIVYQRPGMETLAEEGMTLLADVPQVLMSSTFIRNCLKEGKGIEFMVPLEVQEYIENNGLYRSGVVENLSD